MKKKVKLRAHHIRIIQNMKRDEKGIEDTIRLLNFMYDKKFCQKYITFIEEIDNNTLVEVVDCLDDLCYDCECPHIEECKTHNYKFILDKFIGFLHSRSVPHDVIETTKRLIQELTPEIIDVATLKMYDINVDKTYRFGNLKVVK